MAKRRNGKRELINTGTDKRFVRRRGTFAESDVEARSLERPGAERRARRGKARAIVATDKGDDSGPKSSTSQAADLLDVHMLDIAAQIEALLRSVRILQRAVLRVRGVALPGDVKLPSQDVQKRLGELLDECDALRDAVEQAAPTAAML